MTTLLMIIIRMAIGFFVSLIFVLGMDAPLWFGAFVMIYISDQLELSAWRTIQDNKNKKEAEDVQRRL